jgi:RNA exonuclease 4
MVSMKKRRRRSTKNSPVISGTPSSPLNCSVGDDSSTSVLSSSPNHLNRRLRKNNKNRAQKQQQQQQQNQSQESQEAPLSLEEQAQYVALDCEMVGIGSNGTKSSVARVTLVGWNGNVLLDEFIQQSQPVTDYRTFVSGVTEEDLENALMNLATCTQRVLTLLHDKVLVGHALKNDMKALGISHPWYMTRDTAKFEPFMQVRFNDGILWPRKLKELCQLKLQREIQVLGKPHSSYEDAMAAMDLYRTVRRKWEKAIEYKLKKTNEIEKKMELKRERSLSISSSSSTSEESLSSVSS